LHSILRLAEPLQGLTGYSNYERRTTILAGMRANRTHLGTFCVPTHGFEVREQHQPPSIPIVDNNNNTSKVFMKANT